MSEGASFGSFSSGGGGGGGEADISNTPGSTAGAGSGDFHQYRMQRRKENFRVAKLEGEAKKERETQEYQERQQMKQKTEEERTSKKAEKRKKKKQTKIHAKIRKKWEAALEDGKKPSTTTEEKQGEEKGDGAEAVEEEGITLKKDTKETKATKETNGTKSDDTKQQGSEEK